MLIFPAIDLYEGKAVRLFRGDYRQKTVYSDSPVSVALRMKASGASAVHLVDLEGARDGTTPNFDLVTEICKESGLFCEVGGGIRSMDTVERYLSAGIDRVILGTAAVRDPGLIATAVRCFKSRIAVGADIRDGKLSVSGWTEDSDMDVYDFFGQMESLGVKTVICTDISKDGAMHGTNRALYRSLSERYPVHITASGGVSAIEDIRALRDLGLYAAIIGKAYYTGAVSLEQAIREAL